jgi:phosphatidylserine/phosphatidylglycerophosphate/cardiolipin synthase-like enzyme
MSGRPAHGLLSMSVDQAGEATEMRTLTRTTTRSRRQTLLGVLAALTFCATSATLASAGDDRIYFPAVTNVTNILSAQIDNEPPTGRIDMGIWLLSENSITQKLLQAKARGVQIRLLGDRDAVFEQSGGRGNWNFYMLVCAGIPIRLRYNPSWYPEILHWKATIFKAQGIVEFGSANYGPTELAPYSNSNYDDETVVFTDDPQLVGAFETRFDQMWHDTLPYTEADHSLWGDPPYLKNWSDACALETNCDFETWWPQNPDLCPDGPQSMAIDTSRLEPDNPMPPDLIWSQGSDPGGFNDRLIQEINNERTQIDLAIYRLSDPRITQALVSRFQAGVNVRLIVDLNQYEGAGGKVYPEYELVHANVDRLWAAGIHSIRLNTHPVIDGVTHMKSLITSTIATNASSNYVTHWQRDHNYFVPAAAKPAIYLAIAGCFQAMYTDTPGICVPAGGGPHFIDFAPTPADAPTPASPDDDQIASTTPTLIWNRAAWAVSYDVYLGTSPDNLVFQENVPAELDDAPPPTYSWTSPTPLMGGTWYYWKVVSRTFASLETPSEIRRFDTPAS